MGALPNAVWGLYGENTQCRMGKIPNAVWGLYGENTQCRMGKTPNAVWGLYPDFYPPPYELTLLGSSQLKSYTIHTPGMGKTFSDVLTASASAIQVGSLRLPLAAQVTVQPQAEPECTI